jgi:transposase
MLGLSPAVRIFVYQGSTDMRKSFDGLSGIVTQTATGDLLSGDYFVFFNRNRDRGKILLWDRDGFVVWAKRLERGSFQRPASIDDSGARSAVEIDSTTLAMILGGIDVNSAKKRKRYERLAS